MKNRQAFVSFGLLLAFLFMFSAQLTAQDDLKRIHRFGVRGSYKIDEVDLWGAEFSYQIYLKGIRRLEVGLGGMSSNTWNIFQNTYIYQWCFVQIGGLTLYAGPGLGIGYANYGYGEDKFFGVVAADIGIDYTFRLPLQLAVDYRPEYSAWQEVGNEFTNQFSFAIRLAF